VPGGRARYPSTVAMTVAPARVAGVEEIVICTPPKRDGSVPAPVLYAARRAGATHIVKTGGAQAVAAMAYGTESVPGVDRIVGPGNVYVTEAKRQVAGFVGIDGLAGPSELAIVADGECDPRMIALDLIAQAEHDPEAATYFLTPSETLCEKVRRALDDELPHAGRAEIVRQALRHTKLLLVRDLDHAVDVVNDVAAEHVLLLVPEPDAMLEKVRNAGAVFLGPWTAVPYGDYGVASNHVLPTAGTARFSSGLRAADYVTVSSVIEMSPEAARRFTPGTSAIARAEGLVGHAKAMDARAEEAGGA
jgi:histidinol dehydrogenase